jgi:hypothetical protein
VRPVHHHRSRRFLTCRKLGQLASATPIFLMGSGLQGLAELLGQSDQNAMLCEPAASENNPRERVGRSLLLFGLACLIAVVLTHVAEAFHIFPEMGWGHPDSAGHYLDLASAFLGCVTLPLGFLAIIFRRRRTSN